MNTKLLLFLFWMASSGSIFSQNWFQDGDFWTYDVTTGWNASNYGLHSLLVAGDSLMDGVTWKKIRYRQITQPDAYFLARESGNQVLARQLYGNAVHRVYNFDALPGDTIRYSDNLAFYRVIDTSTLFIAGKWRKQQVVHFSDIPSPYAIVQGIGMIGRSDLPLASYFCAFLLPNFPYCTGAVDGYDFRFRCFEDAENNQYSPLNICLQVGGNEPQEGIKRYSWPNPTTGVLFVSADIQQLKMYDLTGREIQDLQIDWGGTPRILLPKLPQAVYIIETTDSKGKINWHRILYLPPG